MLCLGGLGSLRGGWMQFAPATMIELELFGRIFPLALRTLKEQKPFRD